MTCSRSHTLRYRVRIWIYIVYFETKLILLILRLIASLWVKLKWLSLTGKSDFDLRFLSLDVLRVYLLWWMMLNVYCLSRSWPWTWFVPVSFFVKKRVKSINIEIKCDNICNVLYLHEILVAILTSFYVLGYRESGLVFKYPINS